MKKAVGVILIVVVVLIAVMFAWGFLENQGNEKTKLEKNNQKSEQGMSEQAIDEEVASDEKIISSAELSEHDKSSDCWIAINGNVYDVTSFLDEHPGGADIILNYCGKDATTAFNSKGGQGKHSSRANALLKDYKLAKLAI